MKNIFFVVTFFLVTHSAESQISEAKRSLSKDKKQERIKQIIPHEEEGALNYHRQTVAGLKINTDGLGILVELGRRKTAGKSNLYSIEVGERKHPKEEKTPPGSPSALRNNYVYGKINNFYYSKLGFSKQQIIGDKGNTNGVEISAIYGGGFSAGLLKPYYLKIGYARIIDDVNYSNNDAVFLDNPQSVYGATGFAKGINEINFSPGVFLKTALRFDYSRYNNFVSALEIGFNAEAYSRKMQQMLLVKNKQVFHNAYVAVIFGKRK